MARKLINSASSDLSCIPSLYVRCLITFVMICLGVGTSLRIGSLYSRTMWHIAYSNHDGISFDECTRKLDVAFQTLQSRYSTWLIGNELIQHGRPDMTLINLATRM